MKKSVILLVVLICCTVILGGCIKSEQEGIKYKDIPIMVATGPSGGIYNPIGKSFSEVLNNSGYQAKTLETSGSVENIDLMKKENVNMMLVMLNYLGEAYNGVGIYAEQEAYKNFRILMPLYPDAVQIVANPDSEIKEVSDLKGKKIAVGAEFSGVEQNAKTVLNAYGITYDDIDEQFLDYNKSMEKMKNGEIDAAFLTSGVPNQAVSKLVRDVNAVIVPINGKGRENLINNYQYFSKGIIPKGVYGNENDVDTIIIMNVLAVSKDIPDEMAYDILTSFYTNFDTIKGSNAVAKQYISFENTISEMSVPFHPGAERFWREMGLLR